MELELSCDSDLKKRPFSGPNEHPEEKKIICDKCQVTFKQKKNLYSHLRKIHGESINENGSKVCALCLAKLRTMSQLHTHLMDNHDIRLNFLELTFYHDDDFHEWKHKIEKDSSACFILKSGPIGKGEGEKFSYYDCHRSLKLQGHCQRPGEKRKRKTKASGSIKSDFTCPAIINVHTQTINEVSEIRASYQSVHIGHSLDVGKLPLTGEERASLASSLSAGIPISTVLDHTRKSYSPTKRFGLTTRKDLYNIAKSFSIKKSSVLHADDATSVNILVKKMENNVDNPVLVYKPVGNTLKEYPAISLDEFLLGQHIHLVCEKLKQNSVESTEQNSENFQTQEDLTINISESRHIIEKEIIATSLNKNTFNDTLEIMKRKLKDSLPKLMKKIDEVNSVDVMKSVQEHFNTINSYLDLKILNNELTAVKEIASARSNKNINPQRKFVIKKKSSKKLSC